MTKKQPMPFMKLYLSILDDPDYIELSRTAKSLYFEFYLLAWNADAGGDILNRDTLRPFTLKNLAARLRTNTGLGCININAVVDTRTYTSELIHKPVSHRTPIFL